MNCLRDPVLREIQELLFLEVVIHIVFVLPESTHKHNDCSPIWQKHKPLGLFLELFWGFTLKLKKHTMLKVFRIISLFFETLISISRCKLKPTHETMRHFKEM